METDLILFQETDADGDQVQCSRKKLEFLFGA